jgi:hypothetical protein
MASSDEINPSRRELSIGLAAIVIVACFAYTREGTGWQRGPRQGSPAALHRQSAWREIGDSHASGNQSAEPAGPTALADAINRH